MTPALAGELSSKLTCHQLTYLSKVLAAMKRDACLLLTAPTQIADAALPVLHALRAVEEVKGAPEDAAGSTTIALRAEFADDVTVMAPDLGPPLETVIRCVSEARVRRMTDFLGSLEVDGRPADQAALSTVGDFGRLDATRRTSKRRWEE